MENAPETATAAENCLLNLIPKCSQALNQLDIILQLTLPKHQHGPASLTKRFDVTSVPTSRALDLSSPVFHTSFWFTGTSRTIMTVPKTSIDEDRPFFTDPCDVGISRDIAPVKPISSMPHLPEQAAHVKLRRRIFAFDPPHRMATLLVGKIVSQKRCANLDRLHARRRSRCISL